MYTPASVGFLFEGRVNEMDEGHTWLKDLTYWKLGFKYMGIFESELKANYLAIFQLFYDFLLPLHPIKAIMSP